MLLKFTKMQGCGNDYIYINCFNKQIDEPNNLSIKLSDRHFGIGSDGIILICPSNIADAKMRMFNLDGSEGKMCGNGIRCVGKYLFDNNMNSKENIVTIETLSGIKTLTAFKDTKGNVINLKVDMGKPSLDPRLIPVNIDLNKIVDYPIEINNKVYNITCVSMGNPHCVIFCNDDIDKLEIDKIGPLFENNNLFPQSINTEFVNIIDKHTLNMRVWERGSGETLACGTGACAVAVAAIENKYCKTNEDITIKLKGGNLVINYNNETVFMTGNANKVYEGEIEI